MSSNELIRPSCPLPREEYDSFMELLPKGMTFAQYVKSKMDADRPKLLAQKLKKLNGKAAGGKR